MQAIRAVCGPRAEYLSKRRRPTRRRFGPSSSPGLFPEECRSRTYSGVSSTGRVRLPQKILEFSFVAPIYQFSSSAVGAVDRFTDTLLGRRAREARSTTCPAELILVAATDPRRRGYRSNPRRACSCTLPQVEEYRGNISGRPLDGNDLHADRLVTEHMLTQGSQRRVMGAVAN